MDLNKEKQELLNFWMSFSLNLTFKDAIVDIITLEIDLQQIILHIQENMMELIQ